MKEGLRIMVSFCPTNFELLFPPCMLETSCMSKLLILCLLRCWELGFSLLPSYWHYSAIISSNIVSTLCSLLLGFPLCIYWYIQWHPTGIWGSAHFSSFFLKSSLNWIISIDFSLNSLLTFFLLRSALETLQWIFHSSLVLHFDSKIFILFFKTIFVFTHILYLVRHLSHFSFHSLIFGDILSLENI